MESSILRCVLSYLQLQIVPRVVLLGRACKYILASKSDGDDVAAVIAVFVIVAVVM